MANEPKAFARLVIMGEEGSRGRRPLSLWLFTDLSDEGLEETFLASYDKLQEARDAARELSERCGCIDVSEEPE